MLWFERHYVWRKVEGIIAGGDDLTIMAVFVSNGHFLLKGDRDRLSVELDFDRVHFRRADIDDSSPASPGELEVWQLC